MAINESCECHQNGIIAMKTQLTKLTETSEAPPSNQQGVAGSDPAGPTRKPGISTIPGFLPPSFYPSRHDSDTTRHDTPMTRPRLPATFTYPILPAHYNFYTTAAPLSHRGERGRSVVFNGLFDAVAARCHSR